jgi:hypothetical protein
VDRGANLALVVVAILLIKHCLFDFVFQTRFQLENKAQYGHPGGLLHGSLQIVGTLPAFLIIAPSLLVGAAILLAEFVTHYHVDWLKEELLRRAGWSPSDARYWKLLGADQLIHGLSYIGIAWILAAGV